MGNCVVVGAQWGDEGKAKITEIITDNNNNVLGLNFEEIERKGIHIKAMQKGQFTATMSGFSIDDFYALMCETNPLAEFRIAEDSDLDFSETYCDFIPEEGLIKHSNVPLWIISPVSAENVGETTAAKAQNVVRISRVWR